MGSYFRLYNTEWPHQAWTPDTARGPLGMEGGGYYGSGRTESVAPGAPVDVDFPEVPVEQRKPEPKGDLGTVPMATPADHVPRSIHLTVGWPEDCPKSGELPRLSPWKGCCGS